MRLQEVSSARSHKEQAQDPLSDFIQSIQEESNELGYGTFKKSFDVSVAFILVHSQLIYDG